MMLGSKGTPKRKKLHPLQNAVLIFFQFVQIAHGQRTQHHTDSLDVADHHAFILRERHCTVVASIELLTEIPEQRV